MLHLKMQKTNARVRMEMFLCIDCCATPCPEFALKKSCVMEQVGFK